MAQKIRVGVIDQHPLFRDGIVFSLAAQPDLEVIGQGTSMRDALLIARESDVIVLDMSLLDRGLEAIEAITQQHPATKILLFTMVTDEERVGAALQRGARGCLLKGASGRDLVHAVQMLHQGESYVSPSLAAKLLMRPHPGSVRAAKPADRFSDLTPREDEILSILVKGRSNKEIGNTLDLSEKTIKHHVTNILQKLQVRNRVEAALVASERIPQRQMMPPLRKST
ncbi:LuxR C-terminal-related transcriptional regulator [Microvirga aerophila]|uniref:DNA-binding response regulator n=1 Tax=Microvirga aerophila TaxID=670291 RepID=A0A512C443_9HYPH|nr:response regulator transcription factor [Microvirga aerophila]GEO18817.1 DNA-binding response regulator [Microvirga aerophila]